MENPLATTMAGLLISMALAIEGATLLGPTMNLLRYPLAVLAAIRAAAVAARDNYETGKQTLGALRTTLENARVQARTFVMLVRDILKPVYGNEYSSAWDVIGFIGSLEAPRSVDELILMLETISSFLTANPALGTAHNISVADVTAVLTTLKDARQAVTDQELTVTNLLAVRNDKIAAVRKALRGLRDELADQLDPLDPRWLTFGFNKPGAQAIPDVVTGLVATLIGPTAVALKWQPSARAEYYHVFKRVQGVDEIYILVGSPADLDFTIENLPTNATIDIVVAAVNNGGEGQRSEAVSIITHTA